MKERYKSHLYAAQTGCTVLFCLVILCGCRVTKIKTACLRGVSENTASIERKILQQIDSVYKSIPDIKYKKIVGSRCINDTIIEVKVLNAN
jgi:PP-loop superfamily ATP-utilizing enzyme